jgi:pentatricopeptide repeat protein
MMQAFSMFNQTNKALSLFHEMKSIGLIPTEFTFSTILSILSEIGNLDEGQRIHQQLKV